MFVDYSKEACRTIEDNLQACNFDDTRALVVSSQVCVPCVRACVRGVCVFVCVCVCGMERETHNADLVCVCVCVCVWHRERGAERRRRLRRIA